jgi:hypothetical protein
LYGGTCDESSGKAKKSSENSPKNRKIELFTRYLPIRISIAP